MTIRDHMHLMPSTVLDVAEVLCCRQSVAAGGVDEIGVVIDNVIGVRGVVVGVELNADTVLDPRHAHAAARVAERLVAERIIVQHEAHAVGAIVVVADVDVEGDVEGLAEVDAGTGHHAAMLARQVRSDRVHVRRGIDRTAVVGKRWLLACAAATGVSDLELRAVLGGGSERIKPHPLQFAPRRRCPR